jgi:hypothetical protein
LSRKINEVEVVVAFQILMVCEQSSGYDQVFINIYSLFKEFLRQEN